ncbi:TPA: DUF2235 domain-containing protein [Stenotrophomonas maltophilia]|nr:DUF2235 domain-containing protein [Stenotrophomonas maltophilia]HEL7630706.1 DUF2235 domain-containing protein [Stenotrophomonas maltophilia]
MDVSVGCFFDGTRNHRLASKRRGDKSDSNVSRLFDVYDADQLRREGQRRKKFSSYIQGVGTEALKEVGDTGTGWHARAGAAAGWGGEGRVNWMLMQVQDHLLDHFTGITVTKAMGSGSTVPVARKMSADLRLSLQDVERLAQAARMRKFAQRRLLEHGRCLAARAWHPLGLRRSLIAPGSIAGTPRVSREEGGPVPGAESAGGPHPPVDLRLLAGRGRGTRILQLAGRCLRSRTGSAAPVWHSRADRFHGLVRYGRFGGCRAELL